MADDSSDPRTRGHVPLFMLLEDCLQDERRIDPRFCPVCLLAVPYLLQGNSPDIPDLQTKHHSLWDACMRNLAVPLSVDEVARHKSGLQRNIDTCTRRSGHEALLKRCDKDHITNPLELFRTLLCLCLTNCLYGVDTSTGSTRGVLDRAHNPRKRFRSANGAWPTRVNQLFPYGPHCTIRPLIMSTVFLADHSPLLVLNAILQLARPRVWDVILEPAHHGSLAWALLSTIVYESGGSASMGTLDADDQQEILPPPLRDAAWLRDGSALHTSAEFLYTIVTGPYARPDDILQFLAPHSPAFQDVFTLALELCHIPAPEQADWTLVVMSLFPSSEKAAQAQEMVSDAVVLRTVEKEPRTRMVLGVVYSALSSYRRHCAGPGCARTTLDLETEGVPLRTCGKCKTMRYCARECQRSDWRRGQIPHKRLCPVLATMQAVADFELFPPAEYARLLLESSIPDDYLALAGRWALSTGRSQMDHVRSDIAFPGMFI